MYNLSIKLSLIILCVFFKSVLFAQKIQPKFLEEVITVLAADSLKGRANFSPTLQMAGNYIAKRFEQLGLSKASFLKDYYHSFIVASKSTNNQQLVLLNEQELFETDFYLHNYKLLTETFTVNNYILLKDTATNNAKAIVARIKKQSATKNFVVVTIKDPDGDLMDNIKTQLKGINLGFPLLVLASTDTIQSIKITLNPSSLKRMLNNIIAVKKGYKYPEKYIMISAHYDHIGISTNKYAKTDSVFNGANDNASGVAATLALADYVSKHNYENSIIFCAFAGEEIGAKGSFALAELMNCNNIIAQINFDMVGAYDNEAKAKAGFMGAIFSNLFTLFKTNTDVVEIDEEIMSAEQIFYRSDNIPFAIKGVPAHTITTYDFNTIHYHKTSDHISTLDFTKMANLINAVMPGMIKLANNEFTPTRIKKEMLNKTALFSIQSY